LIAATFGAMTPRSDLEVSMASLLTPEEIEALVGAALDAGLVGQGSRALSMQGIPPRLWRSSPSAGNEVDQLRADLGLLGGVVTTDDGGPPPLLRWLTNARHRATPRAESMVFAEFIETVAARAGGSSGAEAAPTSVPAVTSTAAPGPVSRTTADGHRVIASWVHLSDIHFGHGGAAHKADQRLILDALKHELRTETPGDVPAPDMMLITGDIAFSGAAVSDDEYDVALAELTAAARACGVALERVYAVPGNHDVNGKATTNKRDQKALRSYRMASHPDETIDDALSDAEMLALLRARQAGYLAFTEHLAPACRALYWKTTIGTEGRRIRLVGLNTALLADIRDDRGKLQLGKHQLTETMMGIDDDEIVIVLSHHPLGDRWLRDEKHARNFMRGRAHVHLCGHMHDAETLGVQSGGGQTLVTIAAGATHDEDYPGAGHGFSYGALIEKPDGYAVRVWPRVFSKKQYRFVRDPEGVPDGQAWVDHAIQG